MKSYLYLLGIVILSFYSCKENPTPSNSQTIVDQIPQPSESEKAINKVVNDAYALISFEKNSAPDYTALKSIFTPNATLINFRNDSLAFSSIDQFVAGLKAMVDSQAMLAFNEVELGGKTEYFGKIGHRISAYGSYFDGADELGEKGVNSFQVLKLNGKWLINSILWDIEKSGQTIPDKYLNLTNK